MTKQRYFVAAGRYQIGQQAFYDWASERLYKEVEKEPHVCGRDVCIDGYVSVDGREFKYLGRYTVSFADGSEYLVIMCGCGGCGRGGREYSELLNDDDWLPDKQMFHANGRAKFTGPAFLREQTKEEDAWRRKVDGEES